MTVHTYLRKLYALQFLPSEHILKAFTKLQEKASSDTLYSLCEYIHSIWIDGTVSPPHPGQFSTRVSGHTLMWRVNTDA